MLQKWVADRDSYCPHVTKLCSRQLLLTCYRTVQQAATAHMLQNCAADSYCSHVTKLCSRRYSEKINHCCKKCSESQKTGAIERQVKTHTKLSYSGPRNPLPKYCTFLSICKQILVKGARPREFEYTVLYCTPYNPWKGPNSTDDICLFLLWHIYSFWRIIIVNVNRKSWPQLLKKYFIHSWYTKCS